MASRPRVRVGIVGAGFVARIHAEAYRQVRGVDVELTCVTAARPERARAFAGSSAWRARSPSSEEVLAEPDVDVVDLCVPAHHHAPLAIAAARAGKHVIVEKPLTGCFGPPATPRAEMLRARPGLRRRDASPPAGRPASGSATRRTGSTPRPSSGRAACSPPRAGRSFESSARKATRDARADQQALGDGRRRLAHRQGLPSARRRALPEGRRRAPAARPARPAASPSWPRPPSSPRRTFRGGHAALPQHRRRARTWRTGGRCSSRFDDGTVAQITAADTVLGGIRNQLAIYAARRPWSSATSIPNDARAGLRARRGRVRRRVHRGEDRDQGGLDRAPARRGLDDRLPAGDPGLRGVRGHRPRAALRRPARPRRHSRSSTAPTSPRTKAAASTSAPTSDGVRSYIPTFPQGAPRPRPEKCRNVRPDPRSRATSA